MIKKNKMNSKDLVSKDSKGSDVPESAVGITAGTDKMVSSDSPLSSEEVDTLASVHDKPKFEGKSSAKPVTSKEKFGKPKFNKNKHRGNKDGNPKNNFSEGNNKISNNKSTINVVSTSDMKPKIVNRALTEVSAPNNQELSLLGMEQVSSNGAIRLREGIIRESRYANNKTGNLGDVYETESEITDFSKIEWTIRPRLTVSMKGGDSTVASAMYGPGSRRFELDQPRVNLTKARKVAQGMGNNYWPFSSLYGNQIVRKPYLPQVIDDIVVVSLNGGAIIREGNVLNSTTTWDHLSTEYIIPGATGYLYYPNTQHVDMGSPVAHFRKVEQYRGINHVLIGDKFTSTKDVWNGVNSEGADTAAISLRGEFAQVIADTLSAEDKMGGNFDENDFYNYPDNQYQTLSHDYQVIYLKHLDNIKSKGTDPVVNRLAGFTDEQGFYYAIQSLVNMTTFFWCVAIAFEKAWYHRPFMQAKLGISSMNDMFLSSMPPAGRNGRLQFIRSLPELLSGLPYNENTVQAFRQWCDTSMFDAQLDAFDELNPILSFRVVLSALEDIGAPEADTLVSFVQDITSGKAKKVSTYWPHVNTAASSNLTSLADATRLEVAPFAIRVKSLITQIPFVIPNGDWLKNFFQYFGNFLFLSRLPDFYPGTNKIFKGSSTQWARTLLNPDNVDLTFDTTGVIKGRKSLTTIFDPKSLTGFLINFATYGDAVNEMVRWLKEAKEIASEWVLYLRSLFKSGDGNASVCFKKVELRGIGDSKTYQVEKVPYKQHILSRFRQTVRVAGFVHFTKDGKPIYPSAPSTSETPTTAEEFNKLELTEAVSGISHSAIKAAVVVPHMPTITKATSPVSGVKAWNAARIGMPLSDADSNFDFGTKGDVFYDSFNPIAKKQSTSDFLDSIEDSTIFEKLQGVAGQSGTYVSADEIKKPWDLYTQYYYFSMMVMPFYPRKGWNILPGYDYYYTPTNTDTAVGKLLGDVYQMASSTDLNPFRSELQYNNFNVFKDAYEEIYDVDDLSNGSIGELRPASSAIRMQYGSANRINVDIGQRVSSDALGFSASYIVLSRINALSIFTANNSKLIGIANSIEDLTQAKNAVTPFIFYTREMQSLLGLPYIPFMGMGTGGSVASNIFNENVYFFVKRTSTSDLDLSTKFRNLTQIITEQKAGLGDAEAYPSISGFGTDLLAHPEEQNKDDLFSINTIAKGGK